MRILDQSGWVTTNFGDATVNPDEQRASLAFNALGNPSVVHNGNSYLTVSTYGGNSWYQDQVLTLQNQPVGATAFALDYDSYGQANVAFSSNGSSVSIAQKGSETGYRWNIGTITMAGSGIRDIDMAIDTTDMSWVAYSDSAGLNVAHYDPMKLGWDNLLLDDEFQADQAGHFSMAADGLGGVGIAYVDSNGTLKYRYNDGNGTWSVAPVIDVEINGLVDADLSADVGLAFDGSYNPLISFCDSNGDLMLAYDPVVVPEPATLGLLLTGALAIRRKRRS